MSPSPFLLESFTTGQIVLCLFWVLAVAAWLYVEVLLFFSSRRRRSENEIVAAVTKNNNNKTSTTTTTTQPSVDVEAAPSTPTPINSNNDNNNSDNNSNSSNNNNDGTSPTTTTINTNNNDDASTTTTNDNTIITTTTNNNHNDDDDDDDNKNAMQSRDLVLDVTNDLYAVIASLSQSSLTDKHVHALRMVVLTGVCMLYMWFVDNTSAPGYHLFAFKDKFYDRDLFIFLFLIIFGVALTCMNIHPRPKARGALPGAKPASVMPSVVLNRPQTEEWKGWMQLGFVMYHYWTAKETYNMIRMFIACYVWMTGFGHVSFFKSKQDFGLIRVTKMLFRLNFLVVILCITMGNRYMLYYVCPLHTFWFLTTYAVMWVLHQYNVPSPSDPPRHGLSKLLNYFLEFKFTALLFMCYLLWDSPFGHQVFDFMFSLPGLYSVLEIKDSLYEWWFRTSLDHYIGVFGMVCAHYFSTYEKLLHSKNLFLKIPLIIIALVGIFLWAKHIFIPLDKYAYNAIHPYTSIIPLICYVTLRNSCDYLRDRYSELFRWLGCITLETYLCQFHIFLSSNAATLVDYLPGYPMCNFFLTTALYIFVSWLLFRATVGISDVLIPYGAKPYRISRNLILVVVIFIALSLFSVPLQLLFGFVHMLHLGVALVVVVAIVLAVHSRRSVTHKRGSRVLHGV